MSAYMRTQGQLVWLSLGAVIHEPDELSQWLRHNDSIINMVTGGVIIIRRIAIAHGTDYKTTCVLLSVCLSVRALTVAIFVRF